MTAHSITLREDHAQELRSILYRFDGKENAAYLLCNKSVILGEPWDGGIHCKYLSREVISIPEQDFIRRSPTIVEWETRSFIHALRSAEENDAILALFHSHTGENIGFSNQDDENEEDLAKLAGNRNGIGTPFLSFIMLPSGTIIGRVWSGPKYKEPVQIIREFGNALKLHYPGRGNNFSPNAFHRQALAFGDALVSDLSCLRIGIVGCGGTGSAVAMLLARAGVGQLLLFDKDIVDCTNLNRLHGASQADADAMRLKVDVVKKHITDMGLGCRVHAINDWIENSRCHDALKACDIVFGCTDDNDGRLILNRLAYYYLIPVFDLGLAIDVSDDTPPRMLCLDGRVTYIYPARTCLMCRDVIDQNAARDEALKRSNPDEYERQKAEAYVVGEGNPRPAVVTFTTEVAAMAVNEMINRMQGFRDEEKSPDNILRQFNHRKDRRPGHYSRDRCPVCDQEQSWGIGDVEPFLGRSG